MDSLRLVLGAAVAATLALASYITVVYVIDKKDGNETLSTSAAQTDAREILSYVPSDTIYFFGGLKPAPLQNMQDFFTPDLSLVQAKNLKRDLEKQGSSEAPPATKMLIGLFIEYMTALQSLQTAPELLGTGEEIDSILYSIGTTPVLRIKLADTGAFNAFVDKAETTARTQAVPEPYGGHTIRTYGFGVSENDQEDTRLAISVDNNYALITLLTPLDTPAARDLILGTMKPAKPLSQTTILSDLQSKYDFHPAYLGYVDHREIMKGLTTPDANDFGRMLGILLKDIKKLNTQAPAAERSESATVQDGDETTTSIAESKAGAQNPLTSIQTQACRRELLALTQMWPRTVFGYTKLNLEQPSKEMAARMLVENTDAAFMAELQKLRGFIPAHLQKTANKPVLGFAVGFNVDALTPIVSKLITNFTQKEYQCPALAALKQNMLVSNPMLALGMVAGMASGVQGISATILDIDGSMNLQQENPSPDIRSIDAIITISAKNPQQLLMMAANFQQGMPPIQLPDDGSPIDLPVPLPAPNLGSVKLALKGNHLVAYIGNKAEQLAKAMANDPLSPTGIFAFNMDFGKYMKFVSNIALAADAEKDQFSEDNKAMLKNLAEMDMQIVESFDITPQGVAFDAEMALH